MTTEVDPLKDAHHLEQSLITTGHFRTPTQYLILLLAEKWNETPLFALNEKKKAAQGFPSGNEKIYVNI